jgi:hypothetical protein
MKCDGTVSERELEKVKILMYKYRDRLPGEYEIYRDHFMEIVNDPDYADWAHDRHLVRGLDLFDQYLNAGIKHDDELDAILEMLEIISEVDEVNDIEGEFIAQVRSHFKTQHNHAS